MVIKDTQKCSRRYFNVADALLDMRPVPMQKERERYLAACAQRGDARLTLMTKAQDLYWIAWKLSVYGDLHLTLEQVRAVASDCDWSDRERAHGLKNH